MPNTIRLVSGTANPEFTQSMHRYLHGEDVKSRIVEANIGKFPDGETRVQVKETVRGYDIYVCQPTCPPVNDNLMELCLIIDALKRASAENITAVIPYFGYARQEKKGMPRVPITAKLVTQLIELAGAKRVVTIDLHAAAIQGFFEIPADNLVAYPVFAQYFQKILGKRIKDAVIVSPDVGGTARARELAETLELPLAIIEKRRDEETGETDTFHLIGEVEGKIAILYDDIISTGGTLIKATKLLSGQKAQEVWVGAPHGVFARGAISQLLRSKLKGIVVSDTIALSRPKTDRLKQISVAQILADAVRRIHEKRSVSAIFKNHQTS